MKNLLIIVFDSERFHLGALFRVAAPAAAMAAAFFLLRAVVFLFDLRRGSDGFQGLFMTRAAAAMALFQPHAVGGDETHLALRQLDGGAVHLKDAVFEAEDGGVDLLDGLLHLVHAAELVLVGQGVVVTLDAQLFV